MSKSRKPKSSKKSPRKKNLEPVEGVVKRHPDGFGFLIAEDPNTPDVYIPRKAMKGIMTNDRVIAHVYPEKNGDRLRGDIQEVLKHSTKRVTGHYHALDETSGILKDKSHGWGQDLRVIRDTSIDVKDGDWVTVEILSYPESEEGLTGRVSAVIADIMDPLNDAKRVLLTNGIPYEFSPKAEKDSAQFTQAGIEKELSNRRDLRNLSLITIDGVTAKDFDDAIYVETTTNGFRLVVAIADVSHYVNEGTDLDDEAYERGTSTYFPNFVAPMLPESLSNGLCSLRPNESRLALVADLHLDFQGELQTSEFYEAVIKSHARVTYGEAQEVLDGQGSNKFGHVAGVIETAGDLAKILMAKRFKEGSLDLEIAETEVEVDETGQPVDVIKAERIFAHRLIEEMMLKANVAVAKLFTNKKAPTLYRVHEEPDKESIDLLQSFLSAFGFQKKLSGGKLQGKITSALQHFSGQPQEHVLNILTLRSMSQAKYSPENIGHFGLGFDNYLHFTSPIRRYPDLIVHRLMKTLISGPKGYRKMAYDELETAGTFLSACEQRSVKAERQMQSIKKARFMEKHVGEVFEGMISSVAKFGVFVLLRQFDVDGLVRVEDLGNDYFQFDEESLMLRGKKTGLTYSLGDPVTVQVAAANSELGQIDFVLKDKT